MELSKGSTIRPSTHFLSEIQECCEQGISLCYQCRKCTNGCPVTFAMDIMPNQVMRAIQFGLEEEVLNSDTIWVCASCQTCTTRCPNDIDIAHVMDALRQCVLKKGIKPAQKNVPIFHQAFLSSIKHHGRVFELGMIGGYKLLSRDFMSDMAMGLKMFTKCKLNLFPHRIKGKKEVRKMFKKLE